MKTRGIWNARIQGVRFIRSIGPWFGLFGLILAPVLATMLWLLATGCAPPGEVSVGARLMFSGEVLDPTTTFEVRFDEPVVEDAQVGQIAPESPLRITPALPGRFLWLSRRSGVFTPTEPPPLGQALRITLRSGWRRSDGQPIMVKLVRLVRTPDFALEEFNPRRFNTNNAPSEPWIELQFNADVDAEAAARHLDFRSGDGQHVAATAVHVLDVGSSPFYDYGNKRVRTWAQRFYENQTNRAVSIRPRRHALAAKDTVTNIVANRLVVTPVHPLPIGAHWQLEVAPGLPSSDHRLRLPKSTSILIGNVIPFKTVNVQARNGLEEGKRLWIEFSKPLSAEINSTNVREWIQITPEIPDPKIHLHSADVTFRGAFKLEQRYQVRIRAGLPGMNGLKLAGAYTNEVTFESLPPRLYFPAFSTEQLSGGHRRFELLTVNTPEIRVRAKLLDATTLIHALRGYRGYLQHETATRSEPYKEVDYNVVAGTTIYQTNFTLTSTLDQPVKTELDWNQILGGKRAGAVFLVAESGPNLSLPRSADQDPARARLGTQALLQLTDLGLCWKTSAEYYWVYVFSYATGQPVEGVALRLMDNENLVIEERTSDRQGIAQFERTEDSAWLMAEKGEDLHAVRLLGSWDYRLPVSHEIPQAFDGDSANTSKLMLFSDRSVYRPGETLFLKAIWRDQTTNGLGIPTHATGNLTCLDARGRRFSTNQLAFSPFGSASVSVVLPTNVLGAYQAELKIEGHTTSCHYFQVQEFQPNAFEIEAKVPAEFAAGVPVEIPVKARYYQGRPITKGRLQWSLEAQDVGFSPDGYADFGFGTRVDYGLGRNATSLSLQGETNYTSEPEFVFRPEIPLNPTAPQPRAVEVLFEMTDPSQQTISAHVRFQRHSSDFYLGFHHLAEVITNGTAIPVHIIAVQTNGQPCPQAQTVKVRLHKIEWQTVRQQSAGRVPAYRSEPELSLRIEQDATTCPLVKEGSQWILATNPAPSLVLAAPEAGQYLIEATTHDAGGRMVVAALSFNVASEQPMAWNYRNETQIDLTPDQTSYQPGQTATILVKTPIVGAALVTIEQDHVLRSFVTNLAGNASTIQVPLRTEDAPNVFVSVFITRSLADSTRQVKFPEFRVGYCQLLVDRPETHLRVEVQPQAQDYLPGQMVAVETTVKNDRGQAVTNAEVTLYAVDEGILSLTGYATPDPHAMFWEPRSLGVWTHGSLPHLMPEDVAELNFHNKGYLIGDGGEPSKSLALRQNFPPCAFWQADLVSDSEGRIQARFPAPDSLTRYRVIAVAQTIANQFGHGESSFRVNKPLMLEPSLPSFANIGDRLLARAVVHSKTGSNSEVEVTVELDDCARDASSTTTGRRLSQRLSLKAQGSATVDFPIEFVAAGAAKWIWRAKMIDGTPADFTDAVRTSMTVGYVAPLLREAHARQSRAASTNLLIEVNPQLLEGQGTVTVALANTRLVELGDAVSHLLHYPYGCAEQTASSLMPWLLLRDFSAALPQMRRKPSEFAAAIEHGVERLLTMQVAGEGLAYWPAGQQPEYWISAYAGLALVLARDRGIPIPAASLDGLLRYLASGLNKSADFMDNPEISDRCLALYTLALAGQPQAGPVDSFFQKRERLSPETRALLALAILRSQGPIDRVAELLKLTPSLKPQGDLWFGCPQRELAIRLLAWCRFQPENPEIPVLVEELLKTQTSGHWTTTQGNAWALLALAEYVDKVEKKIQAASGQLAWGTENQPFHLPAEPMVWEGVFALQTNRLGQPLTLENPQSIPLYTTTRVEARSRIQRQPRQDRGFSLQRQYAVVSEDGRLRELKSARVGDLILVTLRLETRQMSHFVAVDDPLPAVLEPVKPDFKTQETRAGQALEYDWVSDFHEFKRDRALFFRDHLPTGQYVLRYLARVRAAGTATAPSAKVEEMYHPDRFGLAETFEVTTRAAE